MKKFALKTSFCTNIVYIIIILNVNIMFPLTFGKLKSLGTLWRQVIWGLSGNFSKTLNLNGKLSLISALCSLNFNCFSFLMSSSNSRLSRITATKSESTICNQTNMHLTAWNRKPFHSIRYYAWSILRFKGNQMCFNVHIIWKVLTRVTNRW